MMVETKEQGEMGGRLLMMLTVSEGGWGLDKRVLGHPPDQGASV